MSSSQKLYRSLHDQLDQGLYVAALKTCQKILRASPQDLLATTTELQLLIALERYPEALQHSQLGSIERSYCLYKLGRTNEAKEVIEEEDEEEDRGVKVLKAQIDYRLGDFESSRDTFEDLASTVETDSPELIDLTHNSETCQLHLDFLAQVPSLVASKTDSNRLQQIEGEPLQHNLLLPTTTSRFSTTKNMNHTQGSKEVSTSTAEGGGGETNSSQKKKRRSRPLKRGDLSKPRQTPSDRWIPKRERVSMRDQLLQLKERQRGKKKEKVLAATQGGGDGGSSEKTAAAGTSTGSKSTPGTPQQQSGKGGGGGGGKKKKGKK